MPVRVTYAHGFAFGIGLQAIEMSVGVGVGLVFLAREGLSFAMLRRMSEDEEAGRGADSLEASARVPSALACPASLKGVLGASLPRKR